MPLDGPVSPAELRGTCRDESQDIGVIFISRRLIAADGLSAEPVNGALKGGQRRPSIRARKIMEQPH